MTNNSIIEVKSIVKIQPNLWQLPTGAVIGYGALLAPGGFYFCFTCNTAECEHVTTVDEAWITGKPDALTGYQVPASSGFHAATVSAPPISGQVSAADWSAVNDGNKPGAWRARGIEEVPSGFTRTVLQ